MKPESRRTGVRWMRFNLVGAAGIVVQLAVLWMLIALGLEYLLATTLAVELAVLHNFVWHDRFTWADRIGKRDWEIAGRLFRFNLTTGLVSIGGNLVLMRLLVGGGHFRPVVSNLVGIAVCSLINFLVSDRWVFRAPSWAAEVPVEAAISNAS
jgi:putative flippase GtrA